MVKNFNAMLKIIFDIHQQVYKQQHKNNIRKTHKPLKSLSHDQ